MITSRLTLPPVSERCGGCGSTLRPNRPRLHHVRGDERLVECLACARRNGRPGFAQPDVPEQPLVFEGVGA